MKIFDPHFFGKPVPPSVYGNWTPPKPLAQYYRFIIASKILQTETGKLQERTKNWEIMRSGWWEYWGKYRNKCTYISYGEDRCKGRGRESQPTFFCVILHRLSPSPLILIWKSTNFSPDQLKVVPDKELESSDHFQKFLDITL